MKRIAYAFVALAMIAGPAMAAAEDDGDAAPDKCMTVKELLHEATKDAGGDDPTVPVIVKLNHDQQLVAVGVLYALSSSKGTVPKAFDSVTETIIGKSGGFLFWLKDKCITTATPIPYSLVAKLKTLGKTADDEE